MIDDVFHGDYFVPFIVTARRPNATLNGPFTATIPAQGPSARKDPLLYLLQTDQLLMDPAAPWYNTDNTLQDGHLLQRSAPCHPHPYIH